jgi:parallel beta-helix repeat protein
MDELMLRRWKGLLLIAMVFIPMHLTVKAIDEPRIIYIDPSVYIQDIIDNANSNTIILFSPGTYNQTFHIAKQMTITSLDPSRTFINVTTDQNKPAITVSAYHVQISNMTIQNNGPGLYTTGIRILKDNVTIQHCIFQNTPIGISIWSNNNIIDENTFLNCSDEGIVLLSTAYSTANNNTIINCIFKGNCDAIELQKSCYNSIINCLMVNNTHSGIDAIMKDNNHNIVSNCTISHNKVHGIYLTNSNDNRILHCVIEYNADGNIVTPNSENITITKPLLKTVSYTESTAENQIGEPVISNQKSNNNQRTIFSILINIIIKIHTFFSNQ